jgi:hypothetical protein
LSMVTVSASPLATTCRRCALRALESPRRQLSVSTSSPLRSIPPRIIATENDSKDGYPRSDSPDVYQHQQHHTKEPSSSMSSTERLYVDMKGRLGPRKSPGFVEAYEVHTSQVSTKMLSRIRLHPRPALSAQLPVSPSDLLHSDTVIEVNETSTSAIESCISAAMHRLELHQSDHSTSSKTNEKTAIPHDQYMWLSSILEFQFSKQQLVLYGTQRGLGQSRLQRTKLTDCIAIILDEVWNFEKEPELPPGESLVTKST